MGKQIFFLLVSILFVGSVGTVSAETYGGGSGTAEDPYLISEPNHMQAIGEDSNDWGAHFVMVNDVNLAAYTGTSFNIIGNVSNRFTGVFDGNNHKIYNFTYTSNNTKYIGIFGFVGTSPPSGEIKDVQLIEPNVNAGTGTNSQIVGSLAGYVMYGTITRCSVIGGSVSGYQDVGGLLGMISNGPVSDCYSIRTSVSGVYYIGGLAGRNFTGPVTNCYSIGVSVSGDAALGGLIGQLLNGSISKCYSRSAVVLDTDLTSGNDMGGLLGSSSSGTVTTSYSIGAVVSGRMHVGGLVGINLIGTITNCYAAASSLSSSLGDLGGLVGDEVSGTVSASFWDMDTSRLEVSAGGVGKTTTEMHTKSTFTDAGWDFEQTWDIIDNLSYPLFRQSPVGDLNGDGFVNFLDLAILGAHWLEAW